jgi:PHD/YefM family antitoxin component YafN of YafNO toxin-antitoxin module
MREEGEMRPVFAVMPWDFYESLVETLDVLSDPEIASALRECLEDLKRGRLYSHAEAKKRLGV